MSTPEAHAPSPRPNIPQHAPACDAGAEPATVLLVEDDRALRRFLEVTLERAGYRVVAACDGLEAMRAVLSSEVHAVVTDAVMPHLGGRELCSFLRRHPKLKALPVVLLSGSGQSPALQSDAAERPDVCLTKPVRPEELAACVARLLSRPA